MAIPKLLEATHTLTASEWTSFGKYLSMYSKAHSDNIRLYKLLYKNQDTLNTEGCAEKLKTKFPKLTPKGFSNLLSKLFLWFEDWLALETFKHEEFEKELMLVKAYNQRGLFKRADQIAKKIETQIETHRHLDLNQNSTLSALYELQYFSSNPIKNEKGSTLFDNFLETTMHATTERAWFCLLEIANRSRRNDRDNKQFESQLRAIIQSTHKTPLSNILSLTEQTLKLKKLDAFAELKAQLESELINPASDLFLMLSLYLKITAAACWHEGNNDNNTILQAYQLTFKAFDQNKHQKLLSSNLFNGVSALGMILDYDELEAFIQKWLKKVYTDYKQSTYHYCQALNAFRHNKYDKIPSLLSGLEFDNPVYKYTSNALLIIAQYELGEEDIMFTLIYNFKKQLKRNKKNIPPITYAKLINLVDFITLLNKSKYNDNIKLDMQNHLPIFYKSWILDQLKK